jgi:hypothetical protein
LLALAALFAMAASGAAAADDAAAAANCGTMIVHEDGTVAAPASIDPARLGIARAVVGVFALDALSVMLKHNTDALIERIAANPKNAPFDARKRARVTQKLYEAVAQMRAAMGEVYSAGFACAMTQEQLQTVVDFFNTAAGHKFTEGLVKSFKSSDLDDPNAPAAPFDMSVFTSEEMSSLKDFMQSDAGKAFHAAFDRQGGFSKWTDAELEHVRPAVTQHLGRQTEAFMKKEGVAP